MTCFQLPQIRDLIQGRQSRQQLSSKRRSLLTRSTAGHTAVAQSIINRAEWERGGELLNTPCFSKWKHKNHSLQAKAQLGGTFSWKQITLWVLIIIQIKKVLISKHVVLKTNVPFQPFTSEFILVLFQVRARLEPVRFEPLSLFVFVLFGPLLLVLAIVELLIGADGGLDMWDLWARSGEGRLRPLHLGGRRRPTAVVLQAQATGTLPDVVAGFVEIQFDLCNSVSMAGRAPRLAGAVSSVRGWWRRQTLLQESLFFGGLTVVGVCGQQTFLNGEKSRRMVIRNYVTVFF